MTFKDKLIGFLEDCNIMVLKLNNKIMTYGIKVQDKRDKKRGDK